MEADQTPPENEETRLPFDAEFVRFVEAFSRNILGSIPELHGIAIVPLWNNQPENMPPGLLQLRNPQPPYLPSLTLLLKRLAAFNVEVQKDLFGQVGVVEQYLGELDKRVKARVEELNQLTKHPEQNDQPAQ
jgi:hypothetical protein